MLAVVLYRMNIKKAICGTKSRMKRRRRSIAEEQKCGKIKKITYEGEGHEETSINSNRWYDRIPQYGRGTTAKDYRRRITQLCERRREFLRCRYSCPVYGG